jgi:molecular chaperone HscA
VEAALARRDRDPVLAAAEALEAGTKIFAERRMDRGIRAALAGRSIDRLDL